MSAEERNQQEIRESTAAAEETMTAQTVPVNVYETPSALVVVAPLPAVTPDDVTIEVHEGRLRFWAGLRSAGTREYLVHEWSYGGYEREVDLPEGYGGAVEASLANGQLAIRVLRGPFEGQRSVQPNAHPLADD